LRTTVNDTRLADFTAEVREFGRDSAMGRDALPKLAHAFARAVADQVIDPAKHADGNDAAARVFAIYAASEGKKSVHDRGPDSYKAQVSKLRQIQIAAAQSKFDFVGDMNRGYVIREKLTKESKKVEPAYAFYVDLAREQNKQDDDLDDAQIETIALPNQVTKEKTVEGQIEKAKKILEDLIAGEKNGLKDTSSEIMIAAEQLHNRLAALLATAYFTKSGQRFL
jgi:hypothetical protein